MQSVSEIFSFHSLAAIGRTSNTTGFCSLPSSPIKRPHSGNLISLQFYPSVSSSGPKLSSTRCSAGRDGGPSPDDSGVGFNFIAQSSIVVIAAGLLPWVWGSVNTQFYTSMNQITQSLQAGLLPWLWCFDNPQFNTYMNQVLKALHYPGTINLLAHLNPLHFVAGTAFIFWTLFVYKWGAKTSGAKGLDNVPVLCGDGDGAINYIADRQAPNNAHPITGGRDGGALTAQQINVSINVHHLQGGDVHIGNHSNHNVVSTGIMENTTSPELIGIMVNTPST